MWPVGTSMGLQVWWPQPRSAGPPSRGARVPVGQTDRGTGDIVRMWAQRGTLLSRWEPTPSLAPDPSLAAGLGWRRFNPGRDMDLAAPCGSSRWVFGMSTNRDDFLWDLYAGHRGAGGCRCRYIPPLSYSRPSPAGLCLPPSWRTRRAAALGRRIHE